MKPTEAQLESAIIELLGVEAYPHGLGEAIERELQKVLIKADLRAFSSLGNTLDSGCIPLSKRHTLLCSV